MAWCATAGRSGSTTIWVSAARSPLASCRAATVYIRSPAVRVGASMARTRPASMPAAATPSLRGASAMTPNSRATWSICSSGAAPVQDSSEYPADCASASARSPASRSAIGPLARSLACSARRTSIIPPAAPADRANASPADPGTALLNSAVRPAARAWAAPWARMAVPVPSRRSSGVTASAMFASPVFSRSGSSSR